MATRVSDHSSRPSAITMSFVLACAVPLSYGLLYPLPGMSPAAIRLVEYGPFAVLLGVTLWRSRSRLGSATRG